MVSPKELLSNISVLAPNTPSPIQRINLINSIHRARSSLQSLLTFPPPKASDRAQVQSREVRLPDSDPISLEEQDVQIALKLSDDLHLNEIDCVQLLVSANQEWGFVGLEPLDKLRLTAGLWYTGRRDLLTALYWLLRAVVLDPGLDDDLVADIQKYLEDLLNSGLRQRLISLIKELNREEAAGLGGPNCEPYIIDSRGALVERRAVVCRERLLLGHCLILSVLVVRASSKDLKDLFSVLKDTTTELYGSNDILKYQSNDDVVGTAAGVAAGVTLPPANTISRPRGRPRKTPRKLSGKPLGRPKKIEKIETEEKKKLEEEAVLHDSQFTVFDNPLFSDDSRVAEAASISQKLRSFAEEDIGRRQSMTVSSAEGNATASRGLEVAVANLQDYCNASQRRELSTMAECAKILSQFNKGTSAMQHYVGLRPMFDVEVMNADTALILGDQDSQPSPSNVSRGLSSLYKEITDTVRQEAATITAVFPSPNDVMSILVQRVMEDRVPKLLEKLLEKPSLGNPPPVEEGGLLLYLRMLAVAYEKTQELARDLRGAGCGDLDVEGLTESLFLPHKDIYIEYEQASLKQLYKTKMEELRAENQLSSESTGSIGRSKGASITSSHQQISVTVVTEFVRWNEEAISRCTLFASQPSSIAANVKPVFTCLLDQVSQYTTEGLERARDSLVEAAALRERFVLGTNLSRRVAAAAASAAEAAAAAGESSFRSFMVAVQRCGSSVAIVQQYFSNSISRLLLPVDGAHAAACEEMSTAMSSAEGAAYKGLQQCIETVMAEVERLLSAEQKATEYRSPDDGLIPDHRPTNACTRVVAYLSRVLEAAFTALDGLNKQAFLTELGNRLHKGLLNHWQKFTFNPGGGLRLKRDITEYGEFVRSFNAPSVDEKFELLGIMANVFIVAPESLSSLFEGTPSIRKDAQRFIQLREDYKSAKLASRLSSLWPST